MERTSLALPRVQPSPRAARKSEWLRRALAHHHSPDSGVENEIVVLATGIDQYLQEVFHHLAHPHQDDTVSAEDFTALCAVLGLTGAGSEVETMRTEDETEDREKDGQNDELRDVYSGLPGQISFKDFHLRLCGYFCVRSGSSGAGECAWRMPVSEDTELVERQIRVRWPRVRRRKCVSFDLTRDQSGPMNRSTKNRNRERFRDLDELGALRELVEDLRSALQGSDARCLALEVALRRQRSSGVPFPSHYNPTVSAPTSSVNCVQGKLVSTDRLTGESGGCARENGGWRLPRRWDIRDPVLRELKLIRSSRDGQLEEAMKFNERLEEELHWAYQEVQKLQRVESSLRKENTQIRRRAEEAREALSLGMQRVRLIQELAQSVPQLQSRIAQLETELLHYRCTCVGLLEEGCRVHPEESCSKTACLLKDAECLQRAVEGKAASDEEEEDRGTEDAGQCCLLEVKRHVCHLNGCDNGHINQVFFQNPSSRVLEKVVTGRLDACGRSQVLQAPDALCTLLASRDLLRKSTE
ncbi:EF-hand and coiled-coil domain-containing protein 1 [Xenentodon cancila]